MKIHVSNIEWDTSDDDETTEAPDLPTEVDLEMDAAEVECDDEPIVDRLSDIYGFCVNSCTIERCGGVDKDTMIDMLAEACAAEFPSASHNGDCVIVDDGSGCNWCVTVKKMEN